MLGCILISFNLCYVAQPQPAYVQPYYPPMQAYYPTPAPTFIIQPPVVQRAWWGHRHWR